MPEDRPSEPRPVDAPNQPAHGQPAAEADERVAFRLNKSAYGQHLGLVHWNEPDRWYHGKGDGSAQR